MAGDVPGGGTQALGREGPIWASGHLALAMEMAQLQPRSKAICLGHSQMQAVLGLDSLPIIPYSHCHTCYPV